MDRIHRFWHVVLTVLFVLSFSLQGIQPAAAQGDGGTRIKRHPLTGKLSFLGAAPGRPITVPAAQARGLSQAERALAMLQPYAADLGLQQPERELKLQRGHSSPGRQVTRFQQTFHDIPVMAGELIVNATDQGGLLSISGEISPQLDLSTDAAITSDQARDTALRAVAKWKHAQPSDLDATAPALWVYDPRLLQPDGGSAALVWRMDVTGKSASTPVDELVLVDAQHGSIRLHFSQVDTLAAPRTRSAPPAGGARTVQPAPAAAFTGTVSTYDMNGSADDNLLPGTFVCDLGDVGCTGGTDPDADAAEAYAKDALDFLNSELGRDSLDGAGMPIILSVHYGDDNSLWYLGQGIFGDGWPLADDIVAHELTHGMTEHESNLYYYFQSGAISESLSDIFGELYDQSNGAGTDTVGVKWLIGEDITGYSGGLRSMSDPGASPFFDPDKMTSANYSFDPDELDSGGVHANAGIGNKAASLLVDGGDFNFHSVTALGVSKTLDIYAEVNDNLLASGADYGDLYYALPQACYNELGTDSISEADCASVQQAVEAVEMNLQPVADYNTDAALCNPGYAPVTRYFDGFESGSGSWLTNSTHWTLGSPYGQYAHTGQEFVYGDDWPDEITDAQMQMSSNVLIPAGGFLHFAHAYDFEYDAFYSEWYDGGVLEYSINGGTWRDAGTLMQVNGYDQTLAPKAYYGNPLGGRRAFAGTSHGYISTRVNLASLANKQVRFRWRMGLDYAGAFWGWWLDDIRIYSCEVSPNATVSVHGTPMGSYYIPKGDSGLHTFTDIQDGPVKVHGVVPLVASERGIFGTYNTFNEVMGFPNNQLTTHYWFPWYDNTNMITWVLVGNPSTTATATVTIKIAGSTVYTNTIPPMGNVTPTFAIPPNGPVEVLSNIPVFTSERALIGWPSGAQSFDEVLGYPHNQLTTHYWFTWYDNKDMLTDIMIGNPSPTATANVTIKIAGVTVQTGPILPLHTLTATFPDVQNGPVEVLANRTVFASERSKFGTSGMETFNEVIGYPHNQLTTNYWFPWYDNTSMITWVLVGNPSPTATANVTIKIAGVIVYTNTIPPFGNVTPTFAVTPDGPVQVTSNIPVFTSERVLKGWPGTGASFNEILGLSNLKLTTDYWFTWFDSRDMSTDVVIARP
jgi:Zn-dependent metalloprotease